MTYYITYNVKRSDTGNPLNSWLMENSTRAPIKVLDTQDEECIIQQCKCKCFSPARI